MKLPHLIVSVFFISLNVQAANIPAAGPPIEPSSIPASATPAIMDEKQTTIIDEGDSLKVVEKQGVKPLVIPPPERPPAAPPPPEFQKQPPPFPEAIQKPFPTTGTQ